MEWLGIAGIAVLLFGLVIAAVLIMKRMQDRGERGEGGIDVSVGAGPDGPTTGGF